MALKAVDTNEAVAETMSSAMIFLLASACGLVAANIYYAQPLAGVIGPELGLSSAATGLIVTLTQIGYGLGLLFVVPLGDLVENRKLIVGTVATAVLALIAAALAPHAGPFLFAMFLVGVSSVAVQMIVPFAAHMTPAAIRGRVVGNVMSGLMVGIMLARPVSSVLSEFVSWRGVFLVSAVAMGILAMVLYRQLPRRMPDAKLPYRALLASMAELARTTPILQRRSAYQAAMFGAFSLFWTTTPLYLSGPGFPTDAGANRALCLGGCGRCDCGSHRRTRRGSRLDMGGNALCAHHCSDVLPRHPYRAGRIPSVSGAAGCRRHHPGLCRHHQSGAEPACHLCARRRVP